MGRRAARARRHLAVAAVLGLAVVSALPAPARGQVATAGALLQRFDFGSPEETLMERASLAATPFSVVVPMTRWVRVEVDGATAEAAVTYRDGSEQKLTGFIDTRATVTAMLGPFALSGTAMIPSGQESYTIGEAQVLGILSHELLPFAITRWGTGGGFGGDLGLHSRLQDADLSLGVGYSVSRESQLFVDASDPYQAAPRLFGRAALDVHGGSGDVFSVGLGMERFGHDAFSGEPMYQSGERLQGAVSYTRPIGARESASLLVSVAHRSKGVAATLLGSPEVPRRLTPPIAGVADAPTRQLVVVGLDLHAIRSRFTLTPDLELRIFRSGDGLGQGWLTTAGASADVRLAGGRFGRRIVVTSWARARVGSLTLTDTSSSSLSGFEAGAAASVVLGVGR